MRPRDVNDRRYSARLTTSFVASLILHAIAALLLFSLATSSSEQASSESVQGAQIVTVTTQAVPQTVAVAVPHAAPPVPHARVAPQRPVAQPKSAPPHPLIHHELAKFAPTAPPNPTPAPQASAAPNPQPTQPEISLTPMPVVAAVPTTVPAKVVAATIRVPATAPPTQAPTAAPTARPVPKVAQPKAPAATFAPLIAQVKPQAVVTPGVSSQIKIQKPKPGVPSPGPTHLPAPSTQHGGTTSPGPKALGSPGPKAVARTKVNVPAKLIQSVPATPRPVSAAPAKKTGSGNLNRRLRNLLPTPGPYAIATPRRYQGDVGRVKPTEPTPPPAILAMVKFTYTENVGTQKWKLWPGGTAPEERYVKMYVTSVRHAGPITLCTGWVVRTPIAGNTMWIVDPDVTFACSGHLEPFIPPSPAPP